MGKKKKDKTEKASLAKLESRFFKRAEVAKTDFDLNYCIPINIGIIAQDNDPQFDQKAIQSALRNFGNSMKKLFGDFSCHSKSTSNDSRVQLNVLVVSYDTSDLTTKAANLLVKEFGATKVNVESYDEMKNKSLLVLALWDGMASGSTFEAVSRILSYTPRLDISDKTKYSLTLPENIPIFQILLPAINNGNINANTEARIKNYTIRDIYPRVLEQLGKDSVWFDRYHYKHVKENNPRRRNFRKKVRKIRNFNEAVIHYSTTGQIDSTANVYPLIDNIRDNQLTPPVAAEMAEMRQICYDVISMKAQEDHRRQMNIVLWSTVLGLIFFAIYSDLQILQEQKWSPFIFYAFIACFVFAFLYFAFSVKRHKSQNFYLEFRAVAESMRVQCFWYLTGIKKSTGDIYNARFNKDMSWVKYTLNRWFESDASGNRLKSRSVEQLPTKINNLVCEGWLENQNGFFSEKIKHKSIKKNFNKKTRFLNRLSFISKVVWGFFAVALAVVLLFGSKSILSLLPIRDEQLLKDILIFGMSLSNIFALAVTYLSEKLLYKILVSRYTYCKLLAEKAVMDYNAHVLNDEKEIFQRYGEQALAENAEWLLIENDREPDVPNG